MTLNNQSEQNFAIVISAPSGSGKTTIIQELLLMYDHFVFAISTTTRKNRPDEEEGKSYYYVTVDDFKKKIENNEFIEWAIVHDNYYGTTQKEVDRIWTTGKIPIFDIDVQGVKQVINKFTDAVFIFIIPPSFLELKNRLNRRGFNTKKEISVRIQNAIKELKEYEDYDYIIVNDKLKTTVDNILSIVRSEKCRAGRNYYKVKQIVKEQHNDST